ncbi:MAG TPA: ABC transporter permease [Bacillota bacterium]|nr:ABC transporter permease [Bacillota bacterium]
MKIWEIFRVALQALSANKLRSFLTTLGIIIGVAAVIIMVSIGQGANQEVVNRISAMGANLITISPGRVAARRGGGWGARGSANVLTDKEVEYIKQGNTTLKAVAPEVSQSSVLRYEGANTFTRVYGVTRDYFTVRDYTLKAGRFFTDYEEEAASSVVIIGETVAEDLFDRENPLGKEIKIGSVRAQVIGVLQPKGTGFADNTDSVYVPIKTAQKRLFGTEYLNSIHVQAMSQDVIDKAVAELNMLMLQRLGDPEKFEIRNQQEILDTVSQTTATFTFLLGGVASIALLVGGIGIMNIMLVSVTERTKEIGIRKALGATQQDILNQFLIEALLLSFLGGFVGVALGFVGSNLVSKLAGWSTVISPGAILLAFSFAAAVGIFFGIYPARKAAGLDPIDALRYE